MNNLEKRVTELEQIVKDLTFKLKEITDTSYKTAKKEIINNEVQFLLPVYNKNGTKVIN